MRNAFISPIVLTAAMTESMCLAAKRLPCGEPPACTRTGRPCGGRAVLSGPREEKKRPLKSIARTFV